MTDEQIIKDSECCIGGYGVRNCDECSLDHKCGCIEMLPEYALDLINRQKAEIEELKRQIESYEDRIYALNATNKLLMDSQETYINNKIKEFAERLIRTSDGDDGYGTVFVFNIEDLVKEMTEKKQ